MKTYAIWITTAVLIASLLFNAGISWANVNENTDDIDNIVEWIETQRGFNEELTKITVRQDETLRNIEDDINDIQEAM